MICGERRVGFSDIVKIKDSSIFVGMPSSWRSPVYHQDRAESIPDSFELIATSDYCTVQAMAHRELPIWSVQFHPEISHGINEYFADPVKEWNDGNAFDSISNKRIIDNFVDICLSR